MSINSPFRSNLPSLGISGSSQGCPRNSKSALFPAPLGVSLYNFDALDELRERVYGFEISGRHSRTLTGIARADPPSLPGEFPVVRRCAAWSRRKHRIRGGGCQNRPKQARTRVLNSQEPNAAKSIRTLFQIEVNGFDRGACSEGNQLQMPSDTMSWRLLCVMGWGFRRVFFQHFSSLIDQLRLCVCEIEMRFDRINGIEMDSATGGRGS